MVDSGQIILSAVLCQSTFPVLDEHGFAMHYKLGEQEIWTLYGGGGPAAIKLSHTNSEFLCLTGTFAPSLKGSTIRCTSTWEGFTHGLVTPTTSHEFELTLQDSTFKTYVPVSGNKVPWGYNGRVTWEFRLGDSIVAQHDTIFELYAVSPWCHEFLARDGIQLDLLRFFVLPTRGDGWYVEQFAPHVVTQVHWHSGFIYNTLNGSERYTIDTTPRRFALTRWLKDLRRNKKAVYKSTLNCVDLAQIVGIAVSLGFQDAKDANALEWCSMMPMGFIKETHLIGWASVTNSPFVDANGDFKPLVDENDVLRQHFKSHWFIRWHSMILDATCGPEVGTKNIDQYLESAIDPCYNQKSHLDSEDKPVRLTGTIKDFWSYVFPAGQDGPIAEHEVITTLDKTWLETNKPLLAKVTQLQPLNAIKLVIDTLVQTLSGSCGPTYVIEPEDLFDLTMDPTKPELGQTIRWPIRCEHDGVVGSLDLQITNFNTSEQATEKNIAYLTNTSRILSETGSQVRRSAVIHITDGPNSVHMFWSFGHLFVSLFSHGLRESAVSPVVHALQVYLEEAGAPSHPDPLVVKSGLATSLDGSALPKTMAVLSTVDVYIEVPPMLHPALVVVLMTV